jgi:hypothetical protein
MVKQIYEIEKKEKIDFFYLVSFKPFYLFSFALLGK